MKNMFFVFSHNRNRQVLVSYHQALGPWFMGARRHWSF